MTYVLFSFAVLFGLTMRKSKVCTVYIVAVMIFLATYNYQNADIANYEIGYSAALQSEFFRYIGYSSLLKFCTNAGLSWIQYRFLFYTVIFILLVIAIKMLTKNVNMVLAFYLITYYGIDVVQMKSHIADTIAFFVVSYMIKYFAAGKSIKSWRTIFAMVVLILSGLMHFSAIFYLFAFFVFVALYHSKNMAKKMIVMLFAAIIVIYGGFISIISQYANLFGILGDMDYLENWFQVHTKYGYLVPTFFVIAAVLSCNLDKHSTLFESSDNQLKINMLIGRFMLTSLILIPLFILNTTYDRLIRAYILIALSYYANEKIVSRMPWSKVIAVIFALITIVFSFYSGTYSFYDTTLGAILKYNSFM